MTLEEINKENARLASTIVKATITDWTGKVLSEFDNYNDALDAYENYQGDESSDVTLNSYDKDGVNHGIFY